jgi:two-component system, NtrC family, sensor histidine kinase HydH
MTQMPKSQAALSALIETFTHPILVMRQTGFELWLANEAYLGLVGLPRKHVEGRPFLDFVNPEERTRMTVRLQLHFEGKNPPPTRAIRRLVPSADGKTHDMATFSQEVRLENGEKGLLIHLLELPDRPPVQTISECLVETSAQLVGAHTQDDVRRVGLEGLAAAGFQASFLSWDGKMMSTADGRSPTDGRLAVEALGEGRPIYGGTSAAEASHVFLPLGDARNGVLWVEGPGLDPSHGSALALFAKVVGTALSEARVQAERARDQWELQALAEVARFVAQPVPPSSEAFLERVAGLLSADAVLLLLQEKPDAPLSLSAQVGLSKEEAAGAALSLGRILGEAAMKAESGTLSEKDEERTLSEASGGRFGSGSAVRITRGGRVVGSLQLLRAPGKPFQQADLRLLGTMVELLVTLLEQHRLRAESARQLSETRLLLDLSRTTSGVLDSASILDVAADFLVRLLDVSNCYILLYDDQAKLLRGAASSATHRDFFRTVTIPLDSDSLAAHVARTLHPIAIADMENTPGGHNDELARRFEEKAVLGLPLTSRDDLIGVVIADDTRGPRLFGPELIELAEATCGQLALSIANARLYESLWMSYAELAAARAEMVKRERLAALGELSAIVAHEVRNPLGVIYNAVTSLRRLLKVEGDSAMLLDILSEESDRLNRIVADLLDFTRPRTPILQPEDMGKVLMDALEAARIQGGPEARSVSYDVEVQPNLPPVHMDRRLIRQGLVNVAVNALQAMPQGGTVRVRCRRELHDNRDHVRIDISDQGMGIPTELLHRVFEPFFTTKAQGTGLGLAVVRRILEEHRGEIAVDSAPGRGTTFTIRLSFLPPTLP